MLSTLLNHRSVRAFTAQTIDETLLNSILDAATRASNTGNMQWYSIVVTTDEKLKQELQSECHFNQSMVGQAPVVLTFCADVHRFNKWCEQRSAKPGYGNFLSLYTATVDAVIAAQNACVAAESYGLGICYLGTTNYTAPRLIEILELPSGVFPVTTVVMGYPNEQPAHTDRLPLSAVVHRQKYQSQSTEDLESMYAEKENLPFHKELVKTNGVENLAQIFTEKRYTLKNNIAFSNTLLDTLKKQGFMNQ